MNAIWFIVPALVLSLAVIHIWWRDRFVAAEARHNEEMEKEKLRQEQQLSEAAAEQRALFNSMSEGVVVLDYAGRIRIANNAALDLFKVDGSISGKTLLEAFRLRELDEILDRLHTERQILDFEFSLPGVQQRIVELNASAVVGQSGRHLGAILVFRDLTRLKALENTRREFVGNVSHELRTPLSLIKGYVETLIDGAKDDPEVAMNFLQTIEKNTDRLTYLIEDLLTISQSESGQIVLNRQPTNLWEIVNDIFADLKPKANERSVRLQNNVAENITVDADAGRLGQVLYNLVDNAIKYGRKEGNIHVSANNDSKEIVVCVQDDGPGIPQEARERVFERFFRVDKARSREQGGTGLGLAIVKHIIQAHGGRVWVESEIGLGSKFYFSLPTAI